MHNGVIINDPYLKEIDLKYNDEKKAFELGLYFATTQNIGKLFFGKCSDEELKEKLEVLKAGDYKLCFHFQLIGTARAIMEPEKYMIEGNPDHLERYISFWRNNIVRIKQTNVSERKKLLKLLEKEGFLSGKDRGELKRKSNNYKSKGGSEILNVAPEFGITFSWSFEEAAKLDKSNRLADEIIKSINDTYSCFFPNKKLLHF